MTKGAASDEEKTASIYIARRYVSLRKRNGSEDC